MYLKSLLIKNFRKFATENNVVEFVDAKSYRERDDRNSINIAPATTLIVGKNNSGKTTITKALEKLIRNNQFYANDFNFFYLHTLLDKYEKEINKNIETPFLEFKIKIGLENDSKDLVTNLVPFMTLDNVDNSELEILIKYELNNDEIFIESITEFLEKYKTIDTNVKFRKFLELIDSSEFGTVYYNINIEKIKFNINDLVELKSIKANTIENDKALSNAFSKIIEYRYKSLLEDKSKEELENQIANINADLTSTISKQHTENINKSLGKIESADKLKVLLSSDLTFKKLMSSLIKYEYVEQGYNIPENQFGLGYTNLMMIIANIIDYMEKYPNQSFNSKVNLISIEEPETFMHPQMQELFIKHINDSIDSLLKSKNKNVNSQLIITSHSSHILNSKIHSGNTFNNINYITTVNQHSDVVYLNDEKVKPDSETNENDLNFLKKHIKYKVSELFFSDAIIFVEGITEETLLHYYIDKNSTLNKYYISIFNINGAHGLVYHKLIELLKVPTLIITDLDIKREDEEKEKYKQIKSLSGRVTTNKTIKRYNNNSDKIDELPGKHEKNNLLITYQGKIHDYYATSFEEAYVLSNYDNDILNNVLKSLKTNIYADIVGENKDREMIKTNSYKIQRKLTYSKSEFANELLYELINTDDDKNIPLLPQYILNSLDWLRKRLEGDNK